MEHVRTGAGRVAPEIAGGITRNAAAASILVALALILLKAWSWLTSGSVSMLSSLADSTLDMVASLFTFFAVRYAATPPDDDHRYGHGKAESFAGLFQAGLVALSSALIAVEALRRFFDPMPVRHGAEAIGVMLVSIALTAGLIWYQGRAVAVTGSVATRGDRAHYAADLAANGVVIVGIAAGAFLGLPWVDAVAGLLVALWLAWSAWGVAAAAADHLMDKELPDEERARIRALALADGAIRGLHDLRTRASGPFVHIQFHADLDPDMTLEAAHRIIVAAERRIRAEYPAADVIIHPDPGDRAEPHGDGYFSEGDRATGS